MYRSMASRIKFLIVSLLIGGSAHAAPITITLSDEDQRVLSQVLDAAAGGQKAGGLEMARSVMYIVGKVQAAAQQQTQHPPDDKK